MIERPVDIIHSLMIAQPLDYVLEGIEDNRELIICTFFQWDSVQLNKYTKKENSIVFDISPLESRLFRVKLIFDVSEREPKNKDNLFETHVDIKLILYIDQSMQDWEEFEKLSKCIYVMGANLVQLKFKELIR